MWRRPNSPTMYMHPGGNGLASTDGEAMAIASPSFFSLRRNPASAIATPVAQERGEDYQIRIDRGYLQNNLDGIPFAQAKFMSFKIELCHSFETCKFHF